VIGVACSAGPVSASAADPRRDSTASTRPSSSARTSASTAPDTMRSANGGSPRRASPAARVAYAAWRGTRIVRPVSVSTTPRRDRVANGTPTASSSTRSAWLTAG